MTLIYSFSLYNIHIAPTEKCFMLQKDKKRETECSAEVITVQREVSF